MEIKDVEILLKGTKYASFIGHIQSIELKNHIYSDIFKIGNDNLGYFALKIRNNKQKHIIESINCMKLLNDPENVIHKNNDIIEKESYLIMVSDWINGIQPIDSNRNSLPTFFSKLAIINKNNIAKGRYTSMYADGKYFETVDELVNWEINYHKEYMDKIEFKEVIEILQNLKKGIPCIIMEEVNTGNLFITNDGEYKFIDTEWMHNGLNLYQFDHFNYFGFEDKTWYNITDEAEECYRAYFNALEIKNEEANEQIRAMELLSVLRQNTFLRFNGNENKGLENKIKTIIGKEKFI